MNVQFLKDISGAYIVDNDLDNISSDQIFNEIYDLTKYIRDVDPELYNEMYSLDKLQQQRIFRNYLDIMFEKETELPNLISGELLTEEPITGLVVGLSWYHILLPIIGFLYRQTITKAIVNAASAIGSVFNTVGGFLAKHGKYMQLRYSIIQENTKKCYVKCGVEDPKKINAMSYFSITSRPTMGGPEAVEQGRCLRECYISNLIDLISLHMESYFSCLKKTGAFEAVTKTDSEDVLKLVSRTNVGVACESYYNAAKEALDSFYKVLDLVYDSHFDSDKRLLAVNTLRSKIYEAKQTIQKIDDRQLQRYNPDNTNRFKNNSDNTNRFNKFKERQNT